MTSYASIGLVAAAALALVGAASAAGAPDSQRQPGPSHRHAAPAQAQTVVPSASTLPARPGRPTTVTAGPRTVHPGGGDPRVTINSQPVPPGHSAALTKTKAR